MTPMLDVLRGLATTMRGAMVLASAYVRRPDLTVAARFQAIYDDVARSA